MKDNLLKRVKCHINFCKQADNPVSDHSHAQEIIDLIRAEDGCREALQELVDLKAYKDKHGKTVEYDQRKPLAWGGAINALFSSPPER